VDVLSSGELQRRLGISKAYLYKLMAEGTIPQPLVVVGSKKYVWPEREMPLIERAVRQRPDGRRRVRPAETRPQVVAA
jgi:predicted DNA-binding transcriptional regulator AlpA